MFPEWKLHTDKPSRSQQFIAFWETIYLSPNRQNLSGFRGWHWVNNSIPMGLGWVVGFLYSVRCSKLTSESPEFCNSNGPSTLTQFSQNPRNNTGLMRAFEPSQQFVKTLSLKNMLYVRICFKLKLDAWYWSLGMSAIWHARIKIKGDGFISSKLFNISRTWASHVTVC